jgi:AcrR family transcriptional regulator
MSHSRKENVPTQGARESLLMAALELFTRCGYAASSVREICQAAGVTKPVLYYYFKSKEGLYLEIMNGISQLFDQRVAELTSASGGVRERLLHFFGSMFDGAHSNLGAVRLAYAIYFGPPQGAPFIDFNRFFDQIILLVDDLIEEGIRTGEIRICERSALCWSLVGSYQTILEEQICRTPPRINRDGLFQVINLILDGVSPLGEAVGNQQGVKG